MLFGDTVVNPWPLHRVSRNIWMAPYQTTCAITWARTWPLVAKNGSCQKGILNTFIHDNINEMLWNICVIESVIKLKTNIKKWRHIFHFLQHPVSGLLPADALGHTHAWIRDNVYCIMSVWALSLAYKKSADFDEDRAKVSVFRTCSSPISYVNFNSYDSKV